MNFTNYKTNILIDFYRICNFLCLPVMLLKSINNNLHHLCLHPWSHWAPGDGGEVDGAVDDVGVGHVMSVGHRVVRIVVVSSLVQSLSVELIERCRSLDMLGIQFWLCWSDGFLIRLRNAVKKKKLNRRLCISNLKICPFNCPLALTHLTWFETLFNTNKDH